MRWVLGFGLVVLVPWGIVYYLLLALGVSEESAPPLTWGVLVVLVAAAIVYAVASGRDSDAVDQINEETNII